MAHDILPKTVDAMLHVQFLDPGRDLLHLLVMAQLLTCSRGRDIGVHGRGDMKADCVHAVQSVENFWSGDGVSRVKVRDRTAELTRKCIGLNATMTGAGA